MSAVAVGEARVARALTAHDRCDRCGAQAYVAVTLASGDLLFCGHHFHVHAPALGKLALAVHDERSKLEG